MSGLLNTSRMLKALADENRLRILHLLSHDELSGTDLMEVLNLGQSRVSTHLALLKEVGLVNDRRAGRRTYYRNSTGPGAEFRDSVLGDAENHAEFQQDLAGLAALHARHKQEKRAYFDRVAASFGDELLPGRTWEGLARALALLAPRVRYADLGIGDGLLTLMLSEIAKSVTAVDLSTEMLSALMSRAKNLGIENIEPVEGVIEDLPLEDESHDVVVLSQALHHAQDPSLALREAHRILVPGGRVLVIDLLAHTEDWVREKLQHVHLGFTEAQLREEIGRAGFESCTVQRVARDPQPPHFMTLLATAFRPSATR